MRGMFGQKSASGRQVLSNIRMSVTGAGVDKGIETAELT